MGEFDLIRRYFTRPTPSAQLGVGDDAALLAVSAGKVLAVSSDMLVSGTHFFPDADPFGLGHKTLAVNLSDLAAMGAQPRWATLALSLPEMNSVWLERFAAGFFALAERHQVELIGGDTTRGALNLCVTIMGEVAQDQALRRDGARPGDDIWVSGELGGAALALAHLQGRVCLPPADFDRCAQRLHQPQPRVELGLALSGWATSAIDVSDGLLADLGHILQRSQVGAQIEWAQLPLATALSAIGDTALRQQCALAGGDDYELCFTAPPALRAALARLSERLPLTRIGTIISGVGCTVLAAGKPINMEKSGYDHFA